jgi:hypothetical protein
MGWLISVRQLSILQPCWLHRPKRRYGVARRRLNRCGSARLCTAPPRFQSGKRRTVSNPS